MHNAYSYVRIRKMTLYRKGEVLDASPCSSIGAVGGVITFGNTFAEPFEYFTLDPAYPALTKLHSARKLALCLKAGDVLW